MLVDMVERIIYEEIVVVNNFSSVFMDNLNNKIRYDSSDLESIRISSAEPKLDAKTIIQEHVDMSKSRKVICVRIFCDCSFDDE